MWVGPTQSRLGGPPHKLINLNKVTLRIMETYEKNGFPILDSKLIITTKLNSYDIKLVDLGEYVQVYYYANKKVRSRAKDKSDLELSKANINTFFDNKEKKKDINLKDGNTIESRNIIRSKLCCQRLAKANMNDWRTFITLTFADNVIDVNLATKKLRNFIDSVKRVKKDFKYLCIPEFQKRGAVHYHLLSNIAYDDTSLIYTQEDNKKYKHIKYWNEGFSSIEVIRDDAKKVVGYISKYMTKDIDDRLFNHRRYLCSRNLNTPKESYINIDNEKELEYYKKITQDLNIIYQNEYINPYDNTTVNFLEFKK